jgi:hypothetical protein
MIIGGILGLMISQVRPPIFESSAIFSVTIDYTQTGALSDIQEDQAMRGVGSVIFSDRVIDNTLSQINNENDTALSRTEFLENSYLDREEFRWTLRYRDPDPKFAEIAVNAWSRNADAVIQEGLAHSLTSLALLEKLENLKKCLIDPSYTRTLINCGNKDQNSIINSINVISTRIQAEKTASQGLFHALSVSLINGGVPSEKAELGLRNLFVLSGALVGLFISFIVTILTEIKRSRSF